MLQNYLFNFIFAPDSIKGEEEKGTGCTGSGQEQKSLNLISTAFPGRYYHQLFCFTDEGTEAPLGRGGFVVPSTCRRLLQASASLAL